MSISHESSAGFAATVALTFVAMLAFAANSLLTRAALGEGLIDAGSFAAVRIASGALILAVLVLAQQRASLRALPDWRAVTMLVVYVVPFSFAYLSLSAGTGALILFGAVQITMFVAGFAHGERFTPFAWLGFALAVLGLVYLVSPGVRAPDALGAGLMAVAGIAWGGYSLRGRHAGDALTATARNFVWAAPLTIAIALAGAGGVQGTPGGIALAVASGTVASGLGYAIWYRALRGLSATRAATVQLSVPVLAAIGGVALLSEPPTLRLVIASLATLGGVWIVLGQRTGS